MMRALGLFAAILVLAFLAFSSGVALRAQTPSRPNALTEIRYCGPPARDASGTIKRSHAVLAAFVKIHPCPANGSRDVDDPCPDWQMNHVLPLAKGGCDAVWNLDWMPKEIKTCAHWWCRDRFEMKVYGDPPEIVVPK